MKTLNFIAVTLLVSSSINAMEIGSSQWFLTIEPECWQGNRVDRTKMSFKRIKHGQERIYRVGKSLGGGLEGDCFSIVPTDANGSPKAIKLVNNYMRELHFHELIYGDTSHDEKMVGIEVFPKCAFDVKRKTVLVQGAVDVEPETGFEQFNVTPAWFRECFNHTKSLVIKLRSFYDGNLRTYLTAADVVVTPLDAEKIIRQLVRGLSRVHGRDIAIMDINDENVLYREKKGGLEFDLIDFGIMTKSLSSDPLERARDLLWDLKKFAYMIKQIIAKAGGDDKFTKEAVTLFDSLNNCTSSITNAVELEAVVSSMQLSAMD